MPKGASGGVTFSPTGEEMVSAYRWQIRLEDWYRMPRALRASHVATIRADTLIRYYSSGGE